MTIKRIKAFIVDMFMIYTPILYIITYVVLGGKEEFANSQAAPLIAVTLYAIIQAVLLCTKGQTPGKKAYEIKVADEGSGGNIPFFRALLRFFVFLATVALLFGIFYYFMKKEKRALHDVLSGSIVVNAPNNP